MTIFEIIARANGWELHPKYNKWWRPTNHDGAMYANAARAFRRICEDYNLMLEAAQ